MQRILAFLAFAACLVGLFVALATFCACQGCKSSGGAGSNGGSGARDGRAGADAVPAARLYLVSDLAGALETCGCVKDQLGGMDKFGALVTKEHLSAAGEVLKTESVFAAFPPAGCK